MKVVIAGEAVDLGVTETAPTIGIIDYSRRETDDFGVTTVVERGFARRMSVRFAVAFDEVDALQRRLAALRATPTRWIADEDHDWLDFDGFYKDFAIDLALPPTSYCTLTVEGIAGSETVADSGEDPAPPGEASTLKLVQPHDITLAASSVAEDDHAEWASGTTYALGERVIKAATHRVYESAMAANTGNDPGEPNGAWIDIGPTNRWAMFDEALGTATSAATSIAVTVTATGADAVALLDVTGATVRVEAGGYDRMQDVGPGALLFLDMPATTGPVTVTISGSGTVAVGTMLLGKLVRLGVTGAAPTTGITDFSRKEADEFGEVAVVERAWAKRMTAQAQIATAALDLVANRIATVRARPSLWIGDDEIDSLIVYGFFRDFTVEVGENVSTLSLTIEGLSKAPPPAPYVPPTYSDGTPIDELRPYEPGATNSSDPDSPFGGGTVGAVLTALSNITSDNLLTINEKWQLIEITRQYQAQHNAAYFTSLGLHTAYGDDPTATERAAAFAAMNALTSYLESLTPAWDDLTDDTPVSGTALRGLFATLAATVAELITANNQIGNSRALVDGNIYDQTTGNFLTRTGLVTALGISSGFAGQQWGATATEADARNDRIENGVVTIRQPLGGTLGDQDYNTTGAIRIRLPSGDGQSHMIKLVVDVYEYSEAKAQTYELSGYFYYSTGSWLSCTAKLIGGSGAARPVYFGKDGTGWTIHIGDPGSVWHYPAVSIRDVQISYIISAATLDSYKSGWSISIDVGTPPYTASILQPTAGDMVFGLNAYEAWGGALATTTNFKTALGISSGISGQGPLATQSSVDLASQVTGALGTGNAAAGLVNANVSIAANGMLSGAGGGQVTIGGLGYTGALNATYGARAGTSLYGSDGTTVMSQADVRTSEGVAASISGQGALATQNSIAYGSGFVTGFGTFAALSQINAGNITSYIANQAIGSTVIANAAIGTAQVDQIAASKIVASSLSSISANLGTVTAGSLNINGKFIVDSDGTFTLQSGTTGARKVETAATTKVYNDSGNLTVEIGYLA